RIHYQHFKSAERQILILMTPIAQCQLEPLKKPKTSHNHRQPATVLRRSAGSETLLESGVKTFFVGIHYFSQRAVGTSSSNS
ncbi:MAG TPA: hypothetical protein VFT44_12670, partial [Pyrinomonadaceae bacterium]|nr:hypothetical protein [Pyrinomonadaceae bacterium]